VIPQAVESQIRKYLPKLNINDPKFGAWVVYLAKTPSAQFPQLQSREYRSLYKLTESRRTEFSALWADGRVKKPEIRHFGSCAGVMKRPPDFVRRARVISLIASRSGSFCPVAAIKPTKYSFGL
jgi:hypothetical protein